jgi:hypothetical protein
VIMAVVAQCKDFLPSEIDSICRALEPQEKAAAKERMTLGKVSTGSGKTRDKVGAFAGVLSRTVEKIKDVVEAAEADPDRFGPLVEEMDRTGKVTGAHRKLKQARNKIGTFAGSHLKWPLACP